MKATAYAVMFVDASTRPATVIGADVFSKPSPTIDGSYRVFEIFSIERPTYGEAAEAVRTALMDPIWDWLGVRTMSSRGMMRDSRNLSRDLKSK